MSQSILFRPNKTHQNYITISELFSKSFPEASLYDATFQSMLFFCMCVFFPSNLALLVASALSCLTATSTGLPSCSGNGAPSPRNSAKPSASHKCTWKQQQQYEHRQINFFFNLAYNMNTFLCKYFNHCTSIYTSLGYIRKK